MSTITDYTDGSDLVRLMLYAPKDAERVLLRLLADPQAELMIANLCARQPEARQLLASMRSFSGAMLKAFSSMPKLVEIVNAPAPCMTFHNPTANTVDLRVLGLDPVGPGEDCEIPLHLAAPGRSENGRRTRSAIEQAPPQLQPKDPAEREVWLRVPPLPPPGEPKRIASTVARSPDEPIGVTMLREAREARRTTR